MGQILKRGGYFTMTTTSLVGREVPWARASLWLRSRNFDLTFVSLSAVTAMLPYLAYLLLWKSGLGQVFHTSWGLGADGSDASRQAVNLVVTLFIGGPHMWATFTRTFLDDSFRARYRTFLLSSMVIPLVVVLLGTNTLGPTFPILVTGFFAWASVHVLHQIIYIMEAYNRKQGTLSLTSRAIDYAVVLTSLYPLAAYRVSQDTFQIGPVNISDVVPLWLQDWSLLFPLALTAFLIALVAFIAKTAREIRHGTVNWPKTLFLSLTVLVAFILPALPNLDIAFQGFNTWHSFQYLALVWYANRLKAEYVGYKSNLLRGLFGTEDGHKYYFFHIGLTAISVLIILFFIVVDVTRFGITLEQVYYMAVLSVLLVHYYHDHVLFSRPGDFMPATLG
jgi:hypothetical protein